MDVLSIGIYAVKELYFTCGLYAVFLGLATAGFFAWRKTMTGSGPGQAKPVAQRAGADDS